MSTIPTYNDSLYTFVGDVMTNTYGVTLPVATDLFGGDAANYIVAPPLVEEIPECYGGSCLPNFYQAVIQQPPVSEEPNPHVVVPEPNYMFVLLVVFVFDLVLRAMWRRRTS